MPTTKLNPQNFEMFSGNTKPVAFDVIDHLDAPVDLTGASGNFALAKNSNGPALFTKAGTLPGSPNNRIEFTIAPADTDALAGTYYYECEVTDQAGRVSTIAFGSVNIKRNLL